MISLIKIDKKKSKEILIFAIPAICESIFVSLLTIVNSFMVSSLGTASIAAVALTNQPYKLLIVFFTAFNVVVTKHIAECMGDSDRDTGAQFLRYGLVVTVVLSALVAIISSAYANEIIILSGSNEDSHDMSVAYFRIFLISMIPSNVSLFLNAAKRGCQNSKVSLYSNLTLNILNVVLGYVLIYGFFGIPSFGIKGAAMAVVLSSLAAMIVSFWSFRNKNDFLKLSDFTFKGIHKGKIKFKLKKFWVMTITLFFELLLTRFGFMLVSAFIARIGTVELAVDKVSMNFLEIVFSFGSGLQAAAITMVGKSLGNKSWSKVKDYSKATLQLGFVISLILSTLFLLFGKDFICLFFSDGSDISYYAQLVAQISAVIVLVQIPQLILNGILRGLGKNTITLCVSVFAILFVMVGSVYFSVYILGVGLIGKWVSSLISQTIWCTLLAISLKIVLRRQNISPEKTS